MANTSAKYTDEYRRETADYIISTGRPTAEVCRELGLNPKTANRWVKDRRKMLSGDGSTPEDDDSAPLQLTAVKPIFGIATS